MLLTKFLLPGDVMKKELMQQYLQVKNEVAKYTINLQKCKNIIREFNSYIKSLKDLAEEKAKSLANVWNIY